MGLMNIMIQMEIQFGDVLYLQKAFMETLLQKEFLKKEVKQQAAEKALREFVNANKETQMNNTLLAYAFNVDRKLVHIDSVKNGLECNCTCPGCNESLVAKNDGKIRRLLKVYWIQ